MVIKAILFDLDNTLVDFRMMKTESCKSAVRAMIGAGLDVPFDVVYNELFELYEEVGIEHKTVFYDLLKRVGWPVDYRIIAHGIHAYRQTKNSHLGAYPNVISTLIELKKKYKLAIVSDAPRMRCWNRLVSANLDAFFDVVITKGDVRREKTTSAPFNTAIRKLGIKPTEAVMVGDRIPRDVLSAKKVGLKTCYARYGDSNPVEPGKSGADFEIDNISELVNLL